MAPRRRNALSPPSPPRRPERDLFADPFALALVEVVCERGFENTRAEDVIARAGADLEEFFSRFADLEDCAIQAFEGFIADFEWRVGSAYFAFSDWRTSLRAAGYEAADWITDHPDLAQFGAVEVLKAKNEMLRVRREEVLSYPARLIDQGRLEAPDPGAVPEAAPLMAIGSVVQLLTHRLQTGEDLDAFATVPQLLYMATRPYVGEELAREELTLPRPPRPTLPPTA